MRETEPQCLAPLSLVIPSYNRAHLIGETVNSALSQTHPFKEIIVVDDGSTDDTVRVLKRFGDRIRIIQTKNRGVQAARNTGVAAAQSKYITLCDSDDLLEPEFTKTVARRFSESPETQVIYCNFVNFGDQTEGPDKFSLAPAGFFKGAKIEGEFLCEIPDLYVRTVSYQPLFPSGSTIERDFYESIGGYNAAFNGVGAEDWEFTLRAVSFGKIALCVRPLVRIRRHLTNDSSDSMRQVIGTAQILEYALANHAEASVHRSVILRSITERRLIAFSAAFARGDFRTATEMLCLVHEKPSSLKFRIKKVIVGLPAPVREYAWRLSQR